MTPARMPRSSAGVKRVRSRRHQMFVTGPSRTEPSAARKIASSAPRRRASAQAAMLTAYEVDFTPSSSHGASRRSRGSMPSWSEMTVMPCARIASRSGGSACDRDHQDRFAVASRPPVSVKRSEQSAIPAAAIASVARRDDRGARSGDRQSEPVGRPLAAVEVGVEGERSPAVDADRLEDREATQEAEVVGVDDGLGRDRRCRGRAPRRRAGRLLTRSGSARPRIGRSRPGVAGRKGVEQRPRLDPRLGDLRRSAANPRRCRRRPTGGCGPSAIANVRIVSASSRSPFGQTVPSAPIEAPRPDRLEGGDVVDRGDLRGARDRAAREQRGQRLGPADIRAQVALDDGDEVDDAGHLARRHEARPAHRAWLADPAEVVALEVDDHHVLGGVLGRRPQRRVVAERAACP